LEGDSDVVDAPEVQQRVVIEMVDARTLECFKGGKGNSIVASGAASRRTGCNGSVGASTVNPGCPTRKKEEHRQHVVQNTILKGKLVDNNAHTRLLEGKFWSLKDIGASMAALLSSGPDSQDATQRDYQDKIKKMADLFNMLPSNLPEVAGPVVVATASTLDNREPNKSVCITAPACGASSRDAAALASIPSPKVNTVQPGNQRAEAGKVSNLTPSNLLN
jgi:hypothetical protein